MSSSGHDENVPGCHSGGIIAASDCDSNDKCCFLSQDKHDFQDSVRVTLDFNLTDPENGPVLDDALPNSVHEHVRLIYSVSL